MGIGLAVVASAAVVTMGGFHVYLVYHNLTTLEFFVSFKGCGKSPVEDSDDDDERKPWRNPYNAGVSQNFQQVFGPNPFLRLRWLLPCIALAPPLSARDFSSRFR